MTRALILAAGQGTRLRPLTNDRPKCLVELLGTSLLERQLNILRSEGVETIQVVTGYRADQIQALGVDTAFNPAFDSTNMVESLFCAIPFMSGEEDLIIAYGDIVYQAENLRALLASNEEIALMIDLNWRQLWSQRLEDPLSDAETLLLDGESVIELGKKPKSYDEIQGQYTGLIKISADRVNALIEAYQSLDRTALYDGQNFANMYMTSFLQLLIDTGWKTQAVLVEGGWLEIDSVEDLETYQGLYAEGALDQFYRADS